MQQQRRLVSLSPVVHREPQLTLRARTRQFPSWCDKIKSVRESPPGAPEELSSRALKSEIREARVEALSSRFTAPCRPAKRHGLEPWCAD